MDSITLLVTALAAGAGAALNVTATEVVKDAYAELKVLITQKIGGGDSAKTILEQYVEKPLIWEGPLKEELKTSGAAEDETILAAAQKLMGHVDPDSAAQGKYNVHILGGGQGVIIGDDAKVTMHFEQPEKNN